jgi:hypothetical protein
MAPSSSSTSRRSDGLEEALGSIGRMQARLIGSGGRAPSAAAVLAVLRCARSAGESLADQANALLALVETGDRVEAGGVAGGALAIGISCLVEEVGESGGGDAFEQLLTGVAAGGVLPLQSLACRSLVKLVAVQLPDTSALDRLSRLCVVSMSDLGAAGHTRRTSTAIGATAALPVSSACMLAVNVFHSVRPSDSTGALAVALLPHCLRLLASTSQHSCSVASGLLPQLLLALSPAQRLAARSSLRATFLELIGGAEGARALGLALGCRFASSDLFVSPGGAEPTHPVSYQFYTRITRA